MEPIYKNKSSLPKLVHYGSKVTFICKFKLKTSILKSVEWYKDNKLILTFTQKLQPQIEIIQHQNLKIDESKSDMHKIAFYNVTDEFSGNYRCEIITENPNNRTIKSVNLRVFAYPERDPIVFMDKSTYTINEELIANCSSGKTLPPTLLDWFINGIKTDKKSIIKEEIISIGAFYRTLSVIKFKINVDSDKLILECAARILNNLPVTKTSVSISLKRSQNNCSKQFAGSSSGKPTFDSSFFIRTITQKEEEEDEENKDGKLGEERVKQVEENKKEVKDEVGEMVKMVKKMKKWEGKLGRWNEVGIFPVTSGENDDVSQEYEEKGGR
ncbi:hypothetical protein O3M35_003507 [Rhynocoris fuscipes]|uniref:Ig-like domain-containing protein n=1 Tax=Rhynocoris fuscipes TaxID=488301 RepID=A0AAW1CLM2_9HEMI